MTKLHRIQKLVKKTLQTISYAMSNEEARYYLNGVYVEVKGGQATMTACDGHQLATIKFDGWVIEGDDISVIVPREAINQVLKTKGDFTVFDLKNNLIKIDDTIINYTPIDAAYPDYKRVFPTKLDYQISFNRRYLLNLCRSIPSDVITFNVNTRDQMQPSLLTSDGAEFLLMPVRS